MILYVVPFALCAEVASSILGFVFGPAVALTSLQLNGLFAFLTCGMKFVFEISSRLQAVMSNFRLAEEGEEASSFATGFLCVSLQICNGSLKFSVAGHLQTRPHVPSVPGMHG